MTVELMATLWPSFSHFDKFAHDPRLMGGVRLNSAMMSIIELDKELEIIRNACATVPLFFDIKGRQLRILEVDVIETTRNHKAKQCLSIKLNHPIHVKTPVPVLFKAGADSAELLSVEEGGTRLTFDGGPRYNVRSGESLHIRHPSLKVLGPIFTDAEKEKIAKVRTSGMKRWFLSYVEKQSDLDEFRELVGRDAELRLKIESKAGLAFTANSFRKDDATSLVLARGDLYVEVDKPHDILNATRLVIEKDPEATVGSRLLLSTVHDEVPSCSDFSELAWLYDVGYRRFLLCDEMCLKDLPLSVAVTAFDYFRKAYLKP